MEKADKMLQEYAAAGAVLLVQKRKNTTDICRQGRSLGSFNDYTEQEFTNEVQSIGQIHHRNLVRMIGYCKQGKHRMLVFEFMPGGSRRTELMLHGDDADGDDVDSAEDMERVDRFARVALWCMDMDPNPLLRPTICTRLCSCWRPAIGLAQAIPDPPDCYMESSPLISLLKD